MLLFTFILLGKKKKIKRRTRKEGLAVLVLGSGRKHADQGANWEMPSPRPLSPPPKYFWNGNRDIQKEWFHNNKESRQNLLGVYEGLHSPGLKMDMPVCIMYVYIFIHSRTISRKSTEHFKLVLLFDLRDVKFEIFISDFKGKKVRDCHHGNK